jgi:hypothetical protein
MASLLAPRVNTACHLGLAILGLKKSEGTILLKCYHGGVYGLIIRFEHFRPNVRHRVLINHFEAPA